MYCPSCGARIIQDSRFCSECGVSPIGLTKEKLQETRNRNKLAVLIYLGVVAAALLLLIIGSLFKPTIHLNNYLKVNFEGYDGYGRASISIDTNKLTEDYGEKLAKLYGMDYIPEVAVNSFVSSFVDCGFDVAENLSNGDKVVCVWNCNDEAALELLGYKLKYSEKEFAVENLMALQPYDPFENITVTFEGLAPYGSAYISNTENEYGLYYELDKRSDLNIGDTVTVTCTAYSDDFAKYMAMEHGLAVSATEKTYTVSGLSSYVTELSDISEEGLKEMQAVAQERYKDGIDGEGSVFTDAEYLGAYLLFDENGVNYSYENKLYLVYELSIQNDYTNGDETFSQLSKIYWYIAYRDITVNDAGELSVDLDSYETPRYRVEIDSQISSGWFGTKTWNYYGHSTVEELYEANIANYATECKLDSSVKTPDAK